MVGLLETTVKDTNAGKVALRLFPRWSWHHNSDNTTKARIWVAWKPSCYHMKNLQTWDQLIHCEATQINSKIQLFISFVYVFNHEQQRRALWHNMENIANQMTEPWCLIGDFSIVLSPADRIGGNEVSVQEIWSFSQCLQNCDLQEMRSIGAHFSWTNQTIWSRIDRAFINLSW